MAAEGKSIDALSQFELTPIFGFVGDSVGFTQSTAHMLLAELRALAPRAAA